MTISEFRKNPLSDELIGKLLQAAEAHAELKTLLTVHSELTNISKQLLDMVDMHYYAASNGSADLSIEIVIYDFHINNSQSCASRFAHCKDTCKLFAASRIEESEVLTALDLAKIDLALKSLDDRHLGGEAIHLAHLPCVAPFWSVLHDLYGPKRQYSILLEAAIAFMRFLTYEDKESPCVHALAILLENLPDCDLVFDGLFSQWTLLTDPRWRFAQLHDHEALLMHGLPAALRASCGMNPIHQKLRAGLRAHDLRLGHYPIRGSFPAGNGNL